MVLKLIGSLLAGLVWGAVFAALGARLRGLARVPLSPSLKLPVDFLVGAWTIGALSLLAGLIGLFSAAGLLPPILVAAAGGRWRGHGWRWRSALWLGIPAAVFLPVALASPFFYDAQVYHLGLPWQALQEGRLSAHPESLFASFPPLAQMINAAPLALGLVRIPAMLHLMSFVAAAALVGAIARRLGATAPIAFGAGSALLLLPSLALVPGLPAADGWATAATMAALALVLGGRLSRDQLLAAGLLAGIATAARLQGLPWTLILIGLVALRLPRRAGWIGLGWLAGSWPWWLKNLILTGMPLAPIGLRGDGMEAAWRDSKSNLYLIDGPSEWLPALVTALAPHLSYAGPLALAAAMALFGPRGRRAQLLGLVVALGLAAWFLTGSLARYIAPSLAVLLALAAAASATRTGRLVTSLALATTLLLGAAITWQQMARWGGAALMVATPHDWPEGLVTHNPVRAFEAASELPPEARVLFVGEARGFGFQRRFAAPSPYDRSPLTEPVEAAVSVPDWLRDEGYTHVLVNLPELDRLTPRHPVEPWTTPAGREHFRAALQELSPPVVMVDNVAIFAVPR